MLRTRPIWSPVALSAVLLVLLAACTSNQDSGSPTAATTVPGTQVYVVGGGQDPTAVDGLPAGTLAGVQASAAGASPSDEFKAQLDTINHRLAELGYVYGAESYDATVLLALATQAARTDTGAEVASAMHAVADGGTACTNFADCNDLLTSGGDINYNGVSGPVSLDALGVVTGAPVGIYTYDQQNQLPGYNAPADPTAPATFVDGTLAARASGSPSASGIPSPTGTFAASTDGQLVVGGLLPLTGPQSGFAPAETAGIKLAVKQIDDAGGVLGRPVKFVPGDSGDPATDTAQLTVTSQLAAGVDAVVGPATSSIDPTLVDQLASAGVPLVSPADNPPVSATASATGMVFRIAAMDEMQASALAQSAITAGHQSFVVVAPRGAVGKALAESVAQVVKSGGAQVVATVTYGQGVTSLKSQAGQVAAAKPDAVVVVGEGVAGALVQQLADQGVRASP